MITRLDVSNFRCLRQTSLTFEPLTVLLGPNGSGKSSVLAALKPQTEMRPEDYWRHDGQVQILRKFTLDGGKSASIEQRSGPGYVVPALVSGFRHLLLRLDLNHLRQPNQANPAAALNSSGSNLVNVVQSLSRSQQDELARQLCSLVPLFGDLGTIPTGNGNLQLRFQDRWNPDVWYAPGEVSDGTMLLLAYLTLQYQSPPVDLVAVEEPERGLHPYLLEQLVSLLRKLSRGELGKTPIQVVLATHSPELLDYVEPQEVRFLTRSVEDGSVTATLVPTDDPDWPRYFREYRESLRDAWLSGGLGGVPGSEPAPEAQTGK